MNEKIFDREKKIRRFDNLINKIFRLKKLIEKLY